MGSSSNREGEVSLTGTVRPGLAVVLGNVLIDSRISGELVDEGRIGPRPVGTYQAVRKSTRANLSLHLGRGGAPIAKRCDFITMASAVLRLWPHILAPNDWKSRTDPALSRSPFNEGGAYMRTHIIVAGFVAGALA